MSYTLYTMSSFCQGRKINLRNPNGYGTVYKLGGKRRKPYCVRKVIEYDLNGKAHYEYLGYFEKRQDAMNFLAQYNMTPQEKQNSLTFAQVYETWNENYPKTSKVAKRYEKAYERSLSIKDKLLKDITQSELQAIIDAQDTRGAKVDIKNLYSLVWQYAESNELVEKNRTSFLNVPTATKSTLHKRFTLEEVKTLWEHKDDENVQIILALIYTGCRPNELFSLKKEQLHDTYFEILKGKTENAKRIVPIHKDIKPYIPKVIEAGITTDSKYVVWADYIFRKTMNDLNMEHTPYDCRHTFASMWADNGLNEMYRRFIQGHSAKGIGEQVYTHIDITCLYNELNRLPTYYTQKRGKPT